MTAPLDSSWLNLAVDGAPGMAAYVQADGRLARANHEYAAWFDTLPEGLAERPLQEIVGPDVWPEIAPFVARALGGERVEHSIEVPHPSRGARTVQATCVPHLAPEGVRGFLVRLVDVTPALPAPSDAVGEPDQLLLDAVPARVAYVDAQERFGWSNRAYAAFVGLTPGELRGRSVKDIMTPEGYERIRGYMRRAAQGEAVRYETELPYSTHGPRDVEVTYTPHVRDGRVLGYVAHVLDVTERHRAEEALRKSEAEFRALFEHAASGNAQIETSTGRFVRVNPRLCEIAGRSAAELLTLTPADLTHADDRARDAAELGPLLRGEREVYTNEKRYVRPDGSIVWVLVSATLIRDPQGRPWRTVGVVQDITARKQGEEALRRANVRLRSVLESITDAHFVLDDQLRLLEANPAAERLLQASLRERLGEPLREILPAVVRSEFWRQYQLALVDRSERHFEARSTVVDRWFEAHIYPRDGRLEVYFRDVTERRRAEDAVRESEERLRRLTNALPALVWTTDAQGRTTYLNDRWYEATGIRPAEGLERGWTELMHPDDRAAGEQGWRAAVASGEPLQWEHRLRMRDGSYRWVFARTEPLLGPDGAVQGWIGTGIDIEDRKRAEAALREADRRKDEFLAMLAHELRNPLAPIRTAVELLRRRPGPQSVERAHDVIERQVQHLTRLVDDLLEVSRVTTGKVRIVREQVAAGSIVSHAVEAMRPLLDARRQRLDVEVEDGIVIDADRTRLAQVLGNILHNAVKYTPEGGRIGVSVARAGGDAVFTVRDSGVGIPPDMLEQIFDPFVQADRSLDRAQGGLGVGLTLARRLVELHGGTIAAHSAGAGQGSEFVVRLPSLARCAQPDVAPARLAAVGARRVRVLVVDDNRDAADSLGDLVEALGHDRRVVHDGRAALALASGWLPDLVLLDIGLPELDGYEVARRLRAAHGPGLRLVAVTGYGADEDRRRSREAGFDQHLVKPLDVKVLEGLLTAT